MSGVARNWSLATGVITAGPNVQIYQSPANYTTILKDARFFGYEAALTAILMYARTASGGPYVYLIPQLDPAKQEYDWQGWFVLNPGDILVAGVTGSHTNYWLSGAMLNTGGLPMPTALVAGTLPAQPDVPPPAAAPKT